MEIFIPLASVSLSSSATPVVAGVALLAQKDSQTKLVISTYDMPRYSAFVCIFLTLFINK
jgi:hypothetical protein